MKIKFILLIFFSNYSFIYSNTNNNENNIIHHFCNVDKIDIKIKYPEISYESINIKRNLNSDDNNDEYQPIQIYVDKTYLEYQKNNNPSVSNLYTIIINSFDKCVKTFNKLLKVKPLQNKINFIKNEDLNNWNFNQNNVDSKIKVGGEGISADLLILPKFSINEEINFEYIEGYPVYFDQISNRPTVGVININYNIL